MGPRRFAGTRNSSESVEWSVYQSFPNCAKGNIKFQTLYIHVIIVKFLSVINKSVFLRNLWMARRVVLKRTEGTRGAHRPMSRVES